MSIMPYEQVCKFRTNARRVLIGKSRVEIASCGPVRALPNADLTIDKLGHVGIAAVARSPADGKATIKVIRARARALVTVGTENASRAPAYLPDAELLTVSGSISMLEDEREGHVVTARHRG
jgi:hypothetical protein